MAFISTVPVDNPTTEVQPIYEEGQANSGFVPNNMKVFSHRPLVYFAWENLCASVRANLDLRRYELTTLAAARTLRSSYCMLAHGSVLLKNGFDVAQIAAIAEDYTNADLPQVEVAIMRFAQKIVRDAASITKQDIQILRDHGLSDPEIFDVAATAACAVSSASCWMRWAHNQTPLSLRLTKRFATA